MKIQEFFMGHILPGSQDNYFDSSKVEYLRAQYLRLNFGRPAIENKFKILKAAVARAFEGTDIDPEKIIEEYVLSKYHLTPGSLHQMAERGVNQGARNLN